MLASVTGIVDLIFCSIFHILMDVWPKCSHSMIPYADDGCSESGDTHLYENVTILIPYKFQGTECHIGISLILLYNESVDKATRRQSLPVTNHTSVCMAAGNGSFLYCRQTSFIV